jgi:two-component system response regulator YesN
MYRVILADNEPVFLLGITHLINWEDNNCQVIGTASNREETLALIRGCSPDIVVCGLGMPGLSGLESLDKAGSEFPEVVFIMLTRQEDFEFLHGSRRRRGTEYLLRNRLEAPALKKALVLAAAEREKRRKLNHPVAKISPAAGLRESVYSALLGLLENSGPLLPSDIRLLENEGMLRRFAALYIPLDYSVLPGFDGLSEEEIGKLYYWERDIIEKIGASFFPNVIVPVQEEYCRHLFLFSWGLSKALWEKKIGEFRETLIKSSVRNTRLCVETIASEYCEDSGSLETWLEDISALKTWYYLTGKGVLCCQDIERIVPAPLALEGAGVQLEEILKHRDGEECRVLFDRIVKQMKETPHRRAEALWLCGGLYTAIRKILKDEERERCIPDEDYRRISRLAGRKELVSWVEKIGDTLGTLLDLKPLGHADIIEKARQYILNNLERHISLQDVADHVCISPGYLSTVFKKDYNRNLIDYINLIKMERACELIHQRKYRIYEISYKVGFDNTCYFTRVFRRHIGLSPSEYLKRREKTRAKAAADNKPNAAF